VDKVRKVVDFRLCRQHVAAFYRQHVAAFYRQLGAVNIVGKVERVQLGQLCRKWVIIVARISNVFSTLSSVCMDGTKATQATLSTYDKVACVAFDLVASLYQPL